MTDFQNNLQVLLDEVYEILSDKNTQYGNQNLTKYGEYGILVRMSDKINRLDQFVLHKTTEGEEGKRDAIIDLIGYGLLWMLYERGQYGR